VNIEFKYKTGARYPYQWYYSPQGSEFGNVMAWVYDTYGLCGNDRWLGHGGWLMFKHEEDALLFTLRWS
jgi:hypothetical protein